MTRADAEAAVRDMTPEWRTIVSSAAHAKVLRSAIHRAAEHPPETKHEAEMLLFALLAMIEGGFTDLLLLSDSYQPKTDLPCIAPAGAEVTEQ